MKKDNQKDNHLLFKNYLSFKKKKKDSILRSILEKIKINLFKSLTQNILSFKL